MFSYFVQVAACDFVRETIKRALTQSDDVDVRGKANFIADTDSILRAVSLCPNIDTAEKLKGLIIEYVLHSLHLTTSQREHLRLNDKG